MGDKGIIVKPGSQSFLTLLKGNTIQMNGKTAKVEYFKGGIPNVLMYNIDGRVFAATPEELAMIELINTGGTRRRYNKRCKSRRRIKKYK